MRYLLPLPWCAIVPGTVILDRAAIPRVVVGNAPLDATGRRLILLEGDPMPHHVAGDQPVTPVELDAADAVAHLLSAHLTLAPLDAKE